MERIEDGGREDREKKWEGLLGSLASETNESIIVRKKQVEC